ncbi:hypothetical protein AB3K78_09080 [Leucobacter sp. HNU]|uniref:hypothetical protein n=1 Tax=Leucobacter sp. HNU TaxID=3236805 RepID=UPI003A80DE40
MSKNPGHTFTPDGLRMIAKQRPARDATPKAVRERIHRITDRLGKKKVEAMIRRYEEGESAAAIAKEHGIAASALIRLLRERNVVVRRGGVSLNLARTMANEYEAGATVAELEAKHRLSHGAVLRALHRRNVTMRAKAPRSKARKLH